MSTAPKKRLSPEEYLAIERRAKFRSEYYQGEMFAMVGANRRHNLIAGNLYGIIWSQFRDRRCEVYQNDMRVRVTRAGLYTYPDVVTVCEQPEFLDNVGDVLLNPRAIFEVLSDSTEAYDRGEKFALYRQLDSLREYVLVAQDRMAIDLFQRNDQGQWVLSSFSREDDVVALPAIDCRLSVAEVYEKVNFNEEV